MHRWSCEQNNTLALKFDILTSVQPAAHHAGFATGLAACRGFPLRLGHAAAAKSARNASQANPLPRTRRCGLCRLQALSGNLISAAPTLTQGHGCRHQVSLRATARTQRGRHRPQGPVCGLGAVPSPPATLLHLRLEVGCDLRFNLAKKSA